MPPQEDQEQIKELLEENGRLLADNNRILKLLYHYSIVGFVVKTISFAILIGLPFALYFYVLEPYFEAFGSSYETFMIGINEIPGLKGFEQFFGTSTPKQ